MSQSVRIVLTGGVSGGHLFPLVAVTHALREKLHGSVEFLFVGPSGKFGTIMMEQAGVRSKFVLTGKMRRYFSLANFTDPFKVPIGLIQALWHLFWFMPDAVFAKGGSGSVPVVLAAWLYRIPVMLHDSDATAGRANQFLARYAKRIAIAYPSAQQYFPAEKVALTGNPVRPEVLAGDISRARTHFDLPEGKPTVFFIGGSLGSRNLNDALARILPELLPIAHVIHQTGEEHFGRVVAEAQLENIAPDTELGYRPRIFLSGGELGDAYALADLVISRAGANSIADAAAYGKALILVPLPTAANDEQRKNAYDVAAIGGASVLEEGNLSEHILLSKIQTLLADETLRKDMGEKLRVFYHPDAASLIADGIVSMID
jgi:UDP-N-acetylglucosamine--N-acetylmuramyl-(pentapeptide) pyrophosphoryl-undecaprenol N-acetylglucosamine transferase